VTVSFGFPITSRLTPEQDDLSSEEKSCVLIFNQIFNKKFRFCPKRLMRFEQGDLEILFRAEGWPNNDSRSHLFCSSLVIRIKSRQMRIFYFSHRLHDYWHQKDNQYNQKYFVVTASSQKALDKLSVIARLTI